MINTVEFLVKIFNGLYTETNCNDRNGLCSATITMDHTRFVPLSTVTARMIEGD